MFRGLHHKLYEKKELCLFILDKRLERGSDCSLHLPEEKIEPDPSQRCMLKREESTVTSQSKGTYHWAQRKKNIQTECNKVHRGC